MLLRLIFLVGLQLSSPVLTWGGGAAAAQHVTFEALRLFQKNPIVQKALQLGPLNVRNSGDLKTVLSSMTSADRSFLHGRMKALDRLSSAQHLSDDALERIARDLFDISRIRNPKTGVQLWDFGPSRLFGYKGSANGNHGFIDFQHLGTEPGRFAFEQSVPILPGSAANDSLENYLLFERLREQIIDPLSVRHSLSVEELATQIIDQRSAIAQKLTELSEATGTASPARSAYRSSADQINTSDSALDNIYKSLEAFDGQAHRVDDPLQRRFFKNLVDPLYSSTGELMVALRVQGLRGTNKRIHELIPDAEALLSELQLSTGELDSILHKEIDVIFNDGKAWGEVKSHKHPFEFSDHPSSVRLLEQAEAQLAALQKLGTGGRIELHHFFINGIRPAAARKLEAMGIKVHGVLPE